MKPRRKHITQVASSLPSTKLHASGRDRESSTATCGQRPKPESLGEDESPFHSAHSFRRLHPYPLEESQTNPWLTGVEIRAHAACLVEDIIVN
ncbi:hypothetical protein B296_00015491 [Ensete ventricosum]|uniref:Uncharacterized protein n=1 Tax=Ensete ventricosum TaxID=4639 RepID=A0A427ACP5_ENSVE|nr:hypothetical protein B296_00015491 [Ensete ventricosum]